MFEKHFFSISLAIQASVKIILRQKLSFFRQIVYAQNTYLLIKHLPVEA